MLTLYEYFRSSASFRVRIALNLKNLPYQSIPVHLLKNGGEQFSEHYQKINAQQLVPTLQDENKIMTQSLAIIEYLEETHPFPALLPKDPYEKALVRSFALAIAAEIQPLNNLRVLNYLTNEFQLSEDKKNNWIQYWIHQGFIALEKKLISLDLSGNFCFGNTPTLADICLVPQMYNAKRFACNLSAYPTLVKIATHCEKLPAITRAWPTENTAVQKG